MPKKVRAIYVRKALNPFALRMPANAWVYKEIDSEQYDFSHADLQSMARDATPEDYCLLRLEGLGGECIEESEQLKALAELDKPALISLIICTEDKLRDKIRDLQYEVDHSCEGCTAGNEEAYERDQANRSLEELQEATHLFPVPGSLGDALLVEATMLELKDKIVI